MLKEMKKIKWLIDLLKGEIEIYVFNVNVLNIRSLYKSNTNLNICENHYNCDRVCAEKNEI